MTGFKIQGYALRTFYGHDLQQCYLKWYAVRTLHNHKKALRLTGVETKQVVCFGSGQ